jgi:hypothetical protein
MLGQHAVPTFGVESLDIILPTDTVFFLTFDGRLRYLSRTALDQITILHTDTLCESRVHRDLLPRLQPEIHIIEGSLTSCPDHYCSTRIREEREPDFHAFR